MTPPRPSPAPAAPPPAAGLALSPAELAAQAAAASAAAVARATALARAQAAAHAERAASLALLDAQSSSIVALQQQLMQMEEDIRMEAGVVPSHSTAAVSAGAAAGMIHRVAPSAVQQQRPQPSTLLPHSTPVPGTPQATGTAAAAATAHEHEQQHTHLQRQQSALQSVGGSTCDIVLLPVMDKLLAGGCQPSADNVPQSRTGSLSNSARTLPLQEQQQQHSASTSEAGTHTLAADLQAAANVTHGSDQLQAEAGQHSNFVQLTTMPVHAPDVNATDPFGMVSRASSTGSEAHIIASLHVHTAAVTHASPPVPPDLSTYSPHSIRSTHSGRSVSADGSAAAAAGVLRAAPSHAGSVGGMSMQHEMPLPQQPRQQQLHRALQRQDAGIAFMHAHAPFLHPLPVLHMQQQQQPAGQWQLREPAALTKGLHGVSLQIGADDCRKSSQQPNIPTQPSVYYDQSTASLSGSATGSTGQQQQILAAGPGQLQGSGQWDGRHSVLYTPSVHTPGVNEHQVLHGREASLQAAALTRTAWPSVAAAAMHGCESVRSAASSDTDQQGGSSMPSTTHIHVSAGRGSAAAGPAPGSRATPMVSAGPAAELLAADRLSARRVKVSTHHQDEHAVVWSILPLIFELSSVLAHTASYNYDMHTWHVSMPPPPAGWPACRGLSLTW